MEVEEEVRWVVLTAEQADAHEQSLRNRVDGLYWTPTAVQAQRAIAQIAPHFESHDVPGGEHVAAKLDSYYLQLVGGQKADKRVIWINAFCDEDMWTEEWRGIPQHVFDGGDCFFNVTYDLDSGEIVDAWVNGDA